MTETSISRNLKESLKDAEYADAYATAFLNSRIATQIKVLREQRGWTQEELAAEANMKQPRIAVMEDVDYSSWSVATLRRLAKAFHVRLKVSFEEFGTMLQEVEDFTRETLQRRPLEDDAAIFGPESNLVNQVLSETWIQFLSRPIALDIEKISNELGQLSATVEGQTPVFDFDRFAELLRETRATEPTQEGESGSSFIICDPVAADQGNLITRSLSQ